MRQALAIAFILATGCATTAASPVNKSAAATLAKYEPTGETTSCLSIPSISQMTAVDERTLLVRVGVSTYYVNKLSGRCSGATRVNNRLQYTTSLSQLCRNDILKVVDNSTGIFSGSCGVGSFEKLTLKPADDAE
ncbi:MAG: DUF6491 family protein [Parvularculaceae bacterium]